MYCPLYANTWVIRSVFFTFLFAPLIVLSSVSMYIRVVIILLVKYKLPTPFTALQPQIMALISTCFTIGVKYYFSSSVFDYFYTYRHPSLSKTIKFDSSEKITVFQNSSNKILWDFMKFNLILLFITQVKDFFLAALP